MVADKNLYQPGETAEILIASPFQGKAYALVTVERGKIRKQEVIQLNGNSNFYRLPITADMGPAVYLTVTVVKGMDETNPYPTYKTSVVRINVSTESKQLDVKVTPDKTKASPGEKVQLNIQTTDLTGKPVSSEVSLALVDLSSLALSEPNSGPIFNFFYSLRGLTVYTIMAHDENIDKYNLALNDLANGEKAGGGGKGGEVPGVMGIRKNFPDTAYWNATIQTDAEGKASITVTLPDNLTTWRVDARAVADETRVGQTTTDILSNKPLMVQPITPRFFIAGDQSQISALLTNNTSQDLPVTTTLEGTGLVINDAKQQETSLKAGEKALLTWKISIPGDSQRVDISVSTRSGDYSDSSTAPLGTLDNQGLPVYRYEAPETVGTSGSIQQAGSRTEGVQLPVTSGMVTGNLKVEIEPSLVNGLEKGFDYLEAYDYESTEVSISRLLSALALKQALTSEGSSTVEMQKKADGIINTTLQKIYSKQNEDGGWGWWGDSVSDPITSAYVMMGLAKMKDSDQQVSSSVVASGGQYLQNAYSTISNDQTIPLQSRLNRQTFILYALTLNQMFSTDLTNHLYDDRANLSYYTQAMLIRIMDLQNHNDKRIQTMVSDLIASAALSSSGASWEEKSHDWWNWNTDIRTTAIVLETLIQVDKQNPLVANAVRWLMYHRTNGTWQSTQESVWSLMALSDWMVSNKEAQANYSYSVSINDTKILEGKVDQTNVQETQSIQMDLSKLLTDQTNKLMFDRSSGDGSMYYTTYMTVNLPVKDIQPLDQGFSISRKYYKPGDTTREVTIAREGDLLLSELTIVVPQSLHYVTIEDPLPAGMEAVDFSLKTNPQALQNQVYDWKSLLNDGWGWWYFTHAEVRDEKIALFADYLPAGTYIYHYFVRATTNGTYQVIPPHGQEAYFPDVYGRGAGE